MTDANTSRFSRKEREKARWGKGEPNQELTVKVPVC